VQRLHEPIIRTENAQASGDGSGIPASGHAVQDPGFSLPGQRYRWHTRQQCGQNTKALMTEIPGGVR
jgi:hypothetical protein